MTSTRQPNSIDRVLLALLVLLCIAGFVSVLGLSWAGVVPSGPLLWLMIVAILAALGIVLVLEARGKD